MEIEITETLRKTLNRLKGKELLKRIEKQIHQISKNPKVGKPLRYRLKDERSVRIGKLRLIYSFDGSRDRLVLLRLMHRKEVYKVV